MPGPTQTINDINFVNGWFAGFKLSDQAVGGTSYYGYRNKKGEYYFMRSIQTGASTAYRFFKPADGGDYATDWTNRAAKDYDFFDVIFP